MQEAHDDFRRQAGIPEEYQVSVPRFSELDLALIAAPAADTAAVVDVPVAQLPTDDGLDVSVRRSEQPDPGAPDTSAGRFYVYALIDPEASNRPFYIGKGFFDRGVMFECLQRAQTIAGGIGPQLALPPLAEGLLGDPAPEILGPFRQCSMRD